MFHRDQFGIWYINSKFWESIKIKDLPDDTEFKSNAQNEIMAAISEDANAKSTKTKYGDTNYTIWINRTNDGDYSISNLSRKSLIDSEDSPLFQEGADIDKFKAEVKEKSKGSGSGGGNSGNKNYSEKKMTLYKNFVPMTIEEFNEANKKDWKITISPKNDPNTFWVSKDGNIQFYVITCEMYWKDNN